MWGNLTIFKCPKIHKSVLIFSLYGQYVCVELKNKTMTTLIAILISLLGYGTSADFDGYTEEQLAAEIISLDASYADDGGVLDWDVPSVDQN